MRDSQENTAKVRKSADETHAQGDLIQSILIFFKETGGDGGQRTAGLKRPPLIRKKTQALTANENPKLNAINNS